MNYSYLLDHLTVLIPSNQSEFQFAMAVVEIVEYESVFPFLASQSPGGDDTLDWGLGGDTLNRNKCNDFLLGNTGTDTIIAGPGNDILRGRNSFLSDSPSQIHSTAVKELTCWMTSILLKEIPNQQIVSSISTESRIPIRLPPILEVFMSNVCKQETCSTKGHFCNKLWN